MVGSHVVDQLRAQGKDVVGITRRDVDLRDMDETRRVFADVHASDVFHSAACVYGIVGNRDNPAQSFLENVQINTSVVDAARWTGCKKFTAMGTGCVYPYPPVRLPLHEDDIFMGRPHPSEAGYAHAKLAMLAQLEAYRDKFEWAYVVSCNLYGPRDKFDIINGHVVPSLIRKFYEAKRDGTDVTVWGDGSAKRDFIYIKDAARFISLVMDQVQGPINMGANSVVSIGEVIQTLAAIAALPMKRIIWDESMPNGVDYRGYDLTRMKATKFQAIYKLDKGLRETWDWYCKHPS